MIRSGPAILPFLWVCCLTIAFTWPLILHFGTSVIGRTGDNVYYVWLIGWVQKALFELPSLPIQAPFLKQLFDFRGLYFIRHRNVCLGNDSAIGLYFYNARYYDSSLGRFIQADMVGQNTYNPQDWDRYAYVHNNPINFTDPTGHDCEAEHD